MESSDQIGKGMDKIDPNDQVYFQKSITKVVFEGTPNQFSQAVNAYVLQYNHETHPYVWRQNKNYDVFLLQEHDNTNGYFPVDIVASPLPNSRSLIIFGIQTVKKDDFIIYCQKLIDYLRSIGWIKPTFSGEQIQALPPVNNNQRGQKNRPRIDVIDRVAVALYAIEKVEIPTYSSAAKRFKTHTETITKYANDPSVHEKLEEFRKDMAVYLRCKQMVSNEKRRKQSQR